jgi:hypothetical protein
MGRFDPLGWLRLIGAFLLQAAEAIWLKPYPDTKL